MADHVMEIELKLSEKQIKKQINNIEGYMNNLQKLMVQFEKNSQLGSLFSGAGVSAKRVTSDIKKSVLTWEQIEDKYRKEQDKADEKYYKKREQRIKKEEDDAINSSIKKLNSSKKNLKKELDDFKKSNESKVKDTEGKLSKEEKIIFKHYANSRKESIKNDKILANEEDKIRKEREKKEKKSAENRKAIVKDMNKFIIDNSKKAFDDIEKYAQRTFGGITATSLGISNLGADFQQELANVNSIMEEGENAFNKYSAGVFELSNAFGKGTKEINKGLYDSISASIDYTKALDFLDVAMRASIAGAADAETASEALIISLNAYGLEVGKVNSATRYLSDGQTLLTEASNKQLESMEALNDVANLQFETVRKGVVTYQQLSENIGLVSSSASKAGIKIDEMYGTIAFTTRSGKAREQMIATARLFDQMADKADNFEAIGVSLYNQQGQVRPLVDIFGDLTDKVKNLAEEQRIQTIQSLSLNERSIKALIPIINNYEKYAETVSDVAGRAGAMDKAFKDASNTFKFLFGQMQQVGLNTLKLIGIELNDQLMEPMKVVASQMRAFFNIISDDGGETIRSLINLGKSVLLITGSILTLVGAYKALNSSTTYALLAISLLGKAYIENIGGIQGKMVSFLNFIEAHPILSTLLGVGLGTKAGRKILELGVKWVLPTGNQTLVSKLLAITGGIFMATTAVATGVAIGLGISWLINPEDTKPIFEAIKNGEWDILTEAFKNTLIEGWNDFLEFTKTNPIKTYIEETKDKLFGEKSEENTKVFREEFKKSLMDDFSEVLKGVMGIKRFANGGYTGSGVGVKDSSGHNVAGVVHDGEYVIPKWMVNSNPNMVASLEAMRQGKKGFAPGGYTGMADFNIVSSSSNPNETRVNVVDAEYGALATKVHNTLMNIDKGLKVLGRAWVKIEDQYEDVQDSLDKQFAKYDEYINSLAKDRILADSEITSKIENLLIEGQKAFITSQVQSGEKFGSILKNLSNASQTEAERAMVTKQLTESMDAEMTELISDMIEFGASNEEANYALDLYRDALKGNVYSFGELQKVITEMEKKTGKYYSNLGKDLGEVSNGLGSVSNGLGMFNEGLGESIGAISSLIGNFSNFSNSIGSFVADASTGNLFGMIGAGISVGGSLFNTLFDRSGDETSKKIRDLQKQQTESINALLGIETDINTLTGFDKIAAQFADAEKRNKEAEEFRIESNQIFHDAVETFKESVLQNWDKTFKFIEDIRSFSEATGVTKGTVTSEELAKGVSVTSRGVVLTSADPKIDETKQFSIESERISSTFISNLLRDRGFDVSDAEKIAERLVDSYTTEITEVLVAELEQDDAEWYEIANKDRVSTTVTRAVLDESGLLQELNEEIKKAYENIYSEAKSKLGFDSESIASTIISGINDGNVESALRDQFSSSIQTAMLQSFGLKELYENIGTSMTEEALKAFGEGNEKFTREVSQNITKIYRDTPMGGEKLVASFVGEMTEAQKKEFDKPWFKQEVEQITKTEIGFDQSTLAGLSFNEQIKLIGEYVGEVDEFTSDYIDKLFGASEEFGKTFTEEVENALSTAFDTILSGGDIYDFSEALGESLYNDVNEALKAAFLESKIYQEQITPIIEKATEEARKGISEASTIQEAISFTQEFQKEFQRELESQGLGFGRQDVGTPEADILVNSAGIQIDRESEGANVINKNFNYQPYYNESVMYSDTGEERLFEKFKAFMESEDRDY